MNGELLTGITAALWLGILTSISPCPLATNIAAVSYIGKNAGQVRRVCLSGFLYLMGRTAAYTALAAAITASLLSIPAVSNFLQQYINKALGPILIIAGMFLLDLIRFPAGSGPDSSRIQRLAEKNIFAASFVMGLLFALAFCPVSAALFFGSLIPMAVQQQSPVLIPAVYGAGTALPVLTFALLLASGANYASKAFNAVSRIELWARRVTGVLFIAIGIYFCLTYIFQIQIL
jgi:cytochrome c-type biogenesis protein